MSRRPPRPTRTPHTTLARSLAESHRHESWEPSLTPRELDFYLALQDHLAARTIPCPRPLATADGRFWRPLAGKPAALCNCLPGHCIEEATVAHCHALGTMLARLHLAGADFPSPLPNPCGHDWRERTSRPLAPAPKRRPSLARGPRWALWCPVP